jgi:hypothetical protein
MTKNQKMFLGIAVLATAGYLIYKQNDKKTFANLRGGSFGLGSGSTSLEPKATCGCSPSAASVGTYKDKVIYDCCGAGVVGYAPGPVVNCDPKGCSFGTPKS